VAFREQASESGLFAAGPTTALFVGRSFQVIQFGLAANAVGIDSGFLHAMAAQGVNLVASAVGVLVPAGIGATDAAFTLAARMLGTTLEKAMSLALLVRCTQLLWTAIGAVVALLGQGNRGRPENGIEKSSLVPGVSSKASVERHGRTTGADEEEESG
jgi:hypothetical protein